MIENTLSKDEINYLLTLPVINHRKDYIQKKSNDAVGKYKFVWQHFATGLGKTKQSVDLIKRIRKVTLEPIIVVVPTNDLYTSWKSQTQGLDVQVYVINTYTMSQKTYKCHTLIIDEVNRAAGNSKYFNTVLDITESQYKVVLAAELEESHINFLKDKGLACRNYLTDKVVQELELSPKSIVYNTPIELTQQEKLAYYNVEKKIQIIEDFFKSLELGRGLHSQLPLLLVKGNYTLLNNFVRGLKQAPGLKDIPDFKLSGMCLGHARDFMKLIGERTVISTNAKNKYVILDKILALEKRQAFIFFSSIASIEEYCSTHPDAIPYHSKLTTKQKKTNMFEFLTTDRPICSIRNLIYGVDLKTKAEEFGVTHKDVELAITLNHTNSKIINKQVQGRIKRLSDNEDKIATMYNVYIEDFTFNGEEINSQEKVRLGRGNKGTITKLKIIE